MPVTWHARTLFAIGCLLAGAAGLALVWYARVPLLLVFGGLLLAICVESAVRLVTDHTRLRAGAALSVVTAAAAALIGFGVWLRGPAIALQVEQLQDRLPVALRALADRFAGYPWTQWLVAQVGDVDRLVTSGVVSTVTSALSSTTALIVGSVIVLFIGGYVAAEPTVYVRGVIRLVPLPYRDRAGAILRQIVHTLRWWLLAKAMAMVVIGVLVAIGLSVIGIPLAGTLGLVAGLLTFIPNIGPILSAAPPLVLALAVSPERALAVALLFWGVHAVEGFAVTPLLERRAVKLPPALTVSVQVLLAVVAGPVGVALAAPLTAVGLVLVRALYVEDILGDRAPLGATGVIAPTGMSPAARRAATDRSAPVVRRPG